MDIKKGDVVRLKSSGPAMTVENIDNTIPGTQLIDCVWFPEKNPTNAIRGSFEPELLVKIS